MDERAAKGAIGLTRDRVEEIRRRMEDGTYVSEAMAEQVARKMIARGEF
jgi:anti-sigma28 factor (negative regulator of flagellin synthesis)